jgi:hypothetical protein
VKSITGTSNIRAFWWLFFCYFFCLLAIGIWVRDVDGQPYLLSTTASFMQGQTMSDPLSFATAAVDIYKNGWVTPANRWIINLWPPGFVLLEAGVLVMFGENAFFVVVLMVLGSLLGAVMLSVLRLYLTTLIPPIAATLLPLLPLCFPVTRVLLVQPLGIVLGEGFSVMFFITAVLLLMLAAREYSLAKAATAGGMLAMAAYFRSQYEMLVLFLTLGAVPVLGSVVFYGRANRATDSVRRIGAVILLAVVTAQILMLPWRLHNFHHTRKLSWVQTQNLVVQNALTTEKKLVDAGGGFVVAGGGHLACLLEPTYCGQSNEKLFYQAFFNHLGQWYQHKFALLDDFWFSVLRDNNLSVPVDPVGFLDWIDNVMLLCLVSVTIPLFWAVRRHPSAVLFAWLIGSFYVCFFGILSLVHFEVRYFFLIKIFAIFTTITLGGLAWSLTRKNDIH